jgi:hypothetical protein
VEKEVAAGARYRKIETNAEEVQPPLYKHVSLNKSLFTAVVTVSTEGANQKNAILGIF